VRLGDAAAAGDPFAVEAARRTGEEVEGEAADEEQAGRDKGGAGRTPALDRQLRAAGGAAVGLQRAEQPEGGAERRGRGRGEQRLLEGDDQFGGPSKPLKP
jgi:hypothetical protein